MEEIVVDGIGITDKEEILDYLMDQYGQNIARLVFSYVKNMAASEELTQEIFIKAYEKLDSFKGRSSIKTWLWQIAINHCKDYLKSWHVRKVILTEKFFHHLHTETDNVENAVLQYATEEIVSRAVLELPLKYREVVFLHYYEELTIREIGEMTGINQNTIKTRLKKAKEMLKKNLKGRI